MKIEQHNLDGKGFKRCHVYPMPIVPKDNYWASVTDVACPVKKKAMGVDIKKTCDGTIRWHEAGYVPGYRICDKCKRHFLAKGNIDDPKLVRVGQRRG